MRTHAAVNSLLLAVCFTVPGAGAAAQVLSPEAHFGFRMGTERRLASAEAMERYFELVDAASDRVVVTDLGPTTDGHRTPAAIISSADNIRNLDAIRQVNLQLADPRTLEPDEARALAARHKTVLAIGAGIHSSEVGATQAANELLHWLASTDDPKLLDVLQNVVVILIPSLNPDGHRLVTAWYERQKGTPFEGGAMPWLYHRYAGHDINRDGFMMNLAENRNLARFFYTQWHPQVFLTMHQMGASGPRFFVPPNVDPIDPNYDPMIWRTAALLGSAMALELQRDGRSGVVSNAMYDYYWPGYEDSAPLGHNIVCLLAEVASVKVATSITVDPADLRGGQKGLRDYRPQINFPDPWPGGQWTLRDIVDYDLSAVEGLLFAVSAYRETIVQNFYDMGRRAVEAGRKGGPFAFIVPPEQFDAHATARLEELLIDGGVEIYRTIEPFRADGQPYPAGTDIILMSQPFRAYAKTLLERQEYPDRRRPPGVPPERPYDAAGWTLPEQMGVQVIPIERYFEPPTMSRLRRVTLGSGGVWGERRPGFYAIETRGNAGAIAVNRLTAAGVEPSWTTVPLDAGGYQYPAGSIVVPHSKAAETAVAKLAGELGVRVDGIRGKAPATARPIGRARVGLYKSWLENIDEGWTRWALDRYEFRFTTVADADIRGGNLRARFDTIILPSASPDRMVNGHAAGHVPPEYAGGLGDAGVAALKSFVEAGGLLICLDQAGQLAIDLFDLPVREITRGRDDFFCPGSILRIELDPLQPLAFGMPAETRAFFAFSSAYDAGPGARTIARYGSTGVLVSGWLEGESLIAGRAAVVEADAGAGRVVLLGFRAQHRGQSHATFRFLFNAVLTAPARPAGVPAAR